MDKKVLAIRICIIIGACIIAFACYSALSPKEVTVYVTNDNITNNTTIKMAEDNVKEPEPENEEGFWFWNSQGEFWIWIVGEDSEGFYLDADGGRYAHESHSEPDPNAPHYKHNPSAGQIHE